MAISYNIQKHAYAFQSKLLAANGGNHIYNIRLTSDMDNGTIIGKGDWVAFDEYEQDSADGSFAGRIVDQAANGNWYVEVIEPADNLLVLEVPELKVPDYKEFTDPKNFYNKTGDVVRAYALSKGDIFEISAEGFTTTPSATSIGKDVSVSAATATLGKLVIAS